MRLQVGATTRVGGGACGQRAGGHGYICDQQGGKIKKMETVVNFRFFFPISTLASAFLQDISDIRKEDK